jgi:hypothetical protein
LVASATTQYTNDNEKGSKVMLTPKSPQKSHAAAIAHMNDLLDEALKETFPASDPIAINVDLKSPDHEIAATATFRTPLRGNVPQCPVFLSGLVPIGRHDFRY